MLFGLCFKNEIFEKMKKSISNHVQSAYFSSNDNEIFPKREGVSRVKA